MLSNPKTSIPGYLLLVSAVLTLAAHAWSGNIGSADWTTVMQALVGVGLISAQDGGH